MTSLTKDIPRRPAEHVMRLARLGSLHQFRLSFMRILTRRLAKEAWSFDRSGFEIDANGVGHAVYTAKGPERSYSLVAFAHDLPKELRSDRVIAEAWDTTFTLFDGVPSEADIERLAQNVPKQEAGRVSERELTLSRANRSVRLWQHVIERLAGGDQPDLEQIEQVGYLMRTTAVYGSGKFGAADRSAIEERSELQVPFQAEMLTVYLIRTFVRDVINHIAKIRGGPKAASLDSGIARRLGIGNSTGLGMAPFLINHPILLNNWMMVREEAIARIRSLAAASASEQQQFIEILSRAKYSCALWKTEHPIQQVKLGALTQDILELERYCTPEILSMAQPWDHLVTWSETALSIEGQELLNSLMLEPYGPLVDGLDECMAAPQRQEPMIDGALSVSKVRKLIQNGFGWALELDWNAREECSRAWYISEEKLEPRLGERFEEPIEAYEQPLAPGRDAALAYKALETWPEKSPISEFLLAHPEHRHIIKRAVILTKAPYAEIRDNTISASLLPIDMLRAKLSFFGATSFDPRSDRWVRICMYAGAPYPDELNTQNSDYWVYPETPALCPH